MKNILYYLRSDNSFIKFIFIGTMTTAIDFIIYMLLSQQLPLSLSKSISMLCSSVFSYIFNKIWSFHNKNKTTLSYLMKFYFTLSINMLINVNMNQFIYNRYGTKIIAFITATGCSTIANFLLQKYWVFKTKEDKQ